MKERVYANLNGVWEIPDDVDKEKFDFSWKPDLYDRAFIHQFGTQWQKTGGPRYVVPGATQVKYVEYPKAKKISNQDNRCWRGAENIEFDWSWHPDDTEPPFIYQFGTQWQKTGGPRYVVPGATQVKYVEYPRAIKKLDSDNRCWRGAENIEFDWSWHPDDTEPPFIYQFGTQWQKTGGPRYVVPGASQIKYVEYPRATKLSNQTDRCWRGAENIEFDWSWHPDETEPPYIYQFGTQWHDVGGPRYVVPGATQVKYVDHPRATKLSDQANRCWRGAENIEFDWSWHPHPDDPPYIYQFGTQWQKTGGPRYVVPGATQIKYVEYPKATKLSDDQNRCWRGAENIEFDWSWHPDETEPPYIYQFGTQWQKTGGPRYVVPGATHTKYVEHPKALKLANQTDRCWRGAENIEFDWSWHPDETEPPYVYQFGTQWQKTGGPRYVVPGASQIKYVEYPKAVKLADRKNWRILYSIDDSSFDWSWHPDEDEHNYKHVFGNDYYSAETMPTVEYSTGKSYATKYIHTIKARLAYPKNEVVFMSNGEKDENRRYEKLCSVLGYDCKWVRGVKGRENAIRRAVEICNTDWVIVFPGKLMVNPLFDFSFQPNRHLPDMHYIFYATNPVNGLEYGHMAAVAYNKKLVLETVEYGLDFTMSKAHDIIRMNSGIAQYNLDPLMTWRTAFREAIKLQLATTTGDADSADRLRIWLTVGEGLNGEYSIKGAKHGVEYYHEVNGDPEKLQLSFDWVWLNQRFKDIV